MYEWVGEVKAVSFTIPSYPEIFTVTLDNSTYIPGGAISVSGSIYEETCSNMTTHGRIAVDNVTFLDRDLVSNGTVHGSTVLVAPLNPGSYSVTVQACYSRNNGAEACTTVSIPYDVAFQCTGTQPTWSSQTSMNEIPSSANTPWTYSAVDTPAKCEFKCFSSYTWNGSDCVSASTPHCTGDVGDNADTYSGDTDNLSQNTPYVYSAVNTPAKCEFGCPSDRPIWTGTSCSDTQYSCSGGDITTNINWRDPVYTGDDLGLTQNTPYRYSSTDTIAKCEFKCGTGYLFNTTTRKCEINTNSCKGTKPAHTEPYSYTEDDDLTNNTTIWKYSASNTSAKCELRCASGFVWDATDGMCELSAYDCTGSLPPNATKYPDDMFNLTGDTPYTYSATDTAPKCQFKCADGYSWVAPNCVLIPPPLPRCTFDMSKGFRPGSWATLCAGDDIGLINDVSVTLVGSCTDGTKCEYVCANGYTYNGMACLVTPLPNLTATNNPMPVTLYGNNRTITFTGNAVNSNVAPVAEGGWADIEFDWDNDGVPPYSNFNAYGGVRLGSFTPGQSKPLSYTHTFNAVNTGIYRYRFYVDTTNDAAESNNDDNYSNWATFRVIGGSITATPTSVPVNGTTVLSWSTQGTTGLTCSAENGTDSFNGLNNSGIVSSPLTASTMYVLRCTDGTQTVQLDQVFVSVTGGTLPTLDANPRTVVQNTQTNLVWDLHGQTNCTLTGGTVNLTGITTNGSTPTTVNGRTTYTLTCPGGSDTATVDVIPKGYET